MIKLVLALAVLVILAVIVILLARVFQHKQQLLLLVQTQGQKKFLQE